MNDGGTPVPPDWVNALQLRFADKHARVAKLAAAAASLDRADGGPGGDASPDVLRAGERQVRRRGRGAVGQEPVSQCLP